MGQAVDFSKFDFFRLFNSSYWKIALWLVERLEIFSYKMDQNTCLFSENCSLSSDYQTLINNWNFAKEPQKRKKYSVSIIMLAFFGLNLI